MHSAEGRPGRRNADRGTFFCPPAALRHLTTGSARRGLIDLSEADAPAARAETKPFVISPRPTFSLFLATAGGKLPDPERIAAVVGSQRRHESSPPRWSCGLGAPNHYGMRTPERPRKCGAVPGVSRNHTARSGWCFVKRVLTPMKTALDAPSAWPPSWADRDASRFFPSPRPAAGRRFTVTLEAAQPDGGRAATCRGWARQHEQGGPGTLGASSLLSLVEAGETRRTSAFAGLRRGAYNDKTISRVRVFNRVHAMHSNILSRPIRPVALRGGRASATMRRQTSDAFSVQRSRPGMQRAILAEASFPAHRDLRSRHMEYRCRAGPGDQDRLQRPDSGRGAAHTLERQQHRCGRGQHRRDHSIRAHLAQGRCMRPRQVIAFHECA